MSKLLKVRGVVHPNSAAWAVDAIRELSDSVDVILLIVDARQPEFTADGMREAELWEADFWKRTDDFLDFLESRFASPVPAIAAATAKTTESGSTRHA